ncbi:MAG: hypothetical protein KME64_06770 [Scytonematopsis contorta HA4267-MV1]|nr:hypothetical protein [Scytonematopsis contorta HA4267-MV1]
MATGKGKKRLKNQPAIYDEFKKRRGVWLTNTAWHKVQELAAIRGMSASELLESIIRGYNSADA